jgi:pimeloyl-ACP methyl ester carboxylesterase
MTAREGSRVVGDGIWAQEVGEGPLVALVHGAMDRSGGMLRVRRALQPSCRVLRYDRRGYARSLPAGPPTSFGQQVDDLAALLDGRPAVLAGHSFGGLICLALAERRPELARSVLAYEAPMSWAAWWPGGRTGQQTAGPSVPEPDPASAREATGADGQRPPGAGDGPGEQDHDAAEWFLRRMLGDELWERLPASMRAERRAEGPTLVAEMRSVRPPAPVPFEPAVITVPVLVAHGAETRPHHVRATEELARRVPRGELAVVPGANHGAHLSHPDEFARLVRRAIEMAEQAT